MREEESRTMSEFWYTGDVQKRAGRRDRRDNGGPATPRTDAVRTTASGGNPERRPGQRQTGRFVGRGRPTSGHETANWGFIAVDGEEKTPDLFVHAKSCEFDFAELAAGDMVNFTIRPGKGGRWRAERVRRNEPGPQPAKSGTSRPERGVKARDGGTGTR